MGETSTFWNSGVPFFENNAHDHKFGSSNHMTISKTLLALFLITICSCGQDSSNEPVKYSHLVIKDTISDREIYDFMRAVIIEQELRRDNGLSIVPQSNADIDYMLKQKEEHLSFKWDNSRLGFNRDNNKQWYVFSVPLFSKDKSKAVMMIEDLYQGLCGYGWTVLFKKENDKWTSQTGARWWY